MRILGGWVERELGFSNFWVGKCNFMRWDMENTIENGNGIKI
jgi:hypothetical protein